MFGVNGASKLPSLTYSSNYSVDLDCPRNGPAHTSVIATGDFDSWGQTVQLSKAKDGDGTWSAEVPVQLEEESKDGTGKQIKYKVCSSKREIGIALKEYKEAKTRQFLIHSIVHCRWLLEACRGSTEHRR